MPGLFICCSISPYLAHILVNRKQITIGTIGGSFALFRSQPGPSEVKEALYNNVITLTYIYANEMEIGITALGLHSIVRDKDFI